MNIDFGLYPIWITTEAFVVDVARAVGLLPPVLTALTVLEESFLAYNGDPLSFDNDRTLSHNLYHFFSVEGAVTLRDKLGPTELLLGAYFSMILYSDKRTRDALQ